MSEPPPKLETTPSSNADYSRKDYWDQRYLIEDEYEWCKGFEDFRQLIEKYVNRSDRILILGCGNSRLGVDLYEAGYKDITNVDSNIVIEKMKSKNSNIPGLKYRVLDMTDLMIVNLWTERSQIN